MCSIEASLARLFSVIDREDVWQRNVAGRVQRDRLLLALFALPGFAGSELLDLDGADIDLERQTLPGSRYGSAVGRNTARSPMLRRGRLFSLERLVRAVSTKEERCRPTASPCRPPATTRRTS